LAEYDEDPITAEPTLFVALLLPPDAQQIEVLDRVADVAANSNPSRPMDAARVYCALGLYEYRSGRYDTSLDRLTDCFDNADPNSPAGLRADLLAAMNYFHLQQRDRAEAGLARARRRIDARFNPPAEVADQVGRMMHHWLINRILLREASELIEGPSTTAGPDPTLLGEDSRG
jgi:hypothetical protein